MNRTSRVLLALAVFLDLGCSKVAIEVGENNDGGPDGPGAGGSAGGADGAGGAGGAGGGGSGSSDGWTCMGALQGQERAVDILFVVDNSPSMDPKQRALAANFPRMIEALQGLEGGLPDVHIGVISSDMGAGGGEAGGNCAVVLGNQGILWGNDPNQNPNNLNNKFATITNFNNGCGMHSGARWISDIQNADGLTRSKNYQGNLSEVFSCLAKSVGVNGCGYEHTLQSLRVALYPEKDVNYDQNKNFLRRRAYLAIVIVSDEDDCSADPNNDTNDGMFMPRTLGDTASLRCAARGHVCNGQAIPNYDPASGYTSKTPFVANFADCEAKDDISDPRNYKSLPLIRIRDIIDSVKGVKDRPEEQIMVAGIIGWPETGNLSGVQYRIDKDLTAMPVEQQKLWDYTPICSLPNEKSADGNIYRAYGGFRLKKFIDGFSNSQTYSICNLANFADAMQLIGQTLALKLRPACVRSPLVDSNPNLPEVQPECMVWDQIPCEVPGAGTCLPSGYEEHLLPQCIDPNTSNPLSPSSPASVFENNIPDSDAARPCWYLRYDTEPDKGCADAPLGQRIVALRKGNGNAPVGAQLAWRCRTRGATTDPLCVPQ